MNALIFTQLAGKSHLNWGFDPALSQWPLAVFSNSGEGDVSENPVEFIPYPDGADFSLLSVAALAGLCLNKYPDTTCFYWVNPVFLVEQFSLDLFNEGVLHQYLRDIHPEMSLIRHTGSGNRFDIAGGHRRHWEKWLEAAEEYLANGKIEDEAPQFSHFESNINQDVLKYSGKSTIHVIGDSHVLYSFSDFNKVGRRNPAIQCMKTPSTTMWLSFNHIGAHTMYHFSQANNFNSQQLEDMGVKNGDTLVLVCGEIDIRNHLKKQVELSGQAPETQVCDLVERYVSNVAAICENKALKNVILCAPTPPLDYSEQKENIPEHRGSIEERIHLTALLTESLQKAARSSGFTFLDFNGHYRTGRGDLIRAVSDGFCHISPFHNYCARQCLMELL